MPMAMVLTLGILPLHHATRINWPWWWAAVAFLLLGSLILAGPYMALKGGVGTKPAIARVLGLAPGSHPQALERERPLPPAQTTLQTYCLATERMVKVVRGVVSTPLVPLALLGLVVMPPGHARTDLVVLRGRAAGVGDRARQAARDSRILHGAPRSGSGNHFDPCRGAWPGLADGQDLDSRRLAGSARATAPAGSGGLGCLARGSDRRTRLHGSGQLIPGPFHVYRDAGAWLAQNAGGDERALDLTDWSLYFSRRPGYRFANVYEAPADPSLRWIIARKPHLDGHWNYSAVLRQLVGQRDPVALIPANPEPGQLQLRIYDRLGPPGQVAAANSTGPTVSARR